MNAACSNLPRLGIDISKDTFDACLILPDESTHRARFNNNSKGFTQLHAWLLRHHAPCTYAGMEATGCYAHALLHFLHHHKHQVYLLNPRKVKSFGDSQGSRVKTDKGDALIIATFMAERKKLQLWRPAPEELILLQAMVRRRQQLLQDLQAERNRLEDPQMASFVRQDIQGHIRQLTTHIKATTKAIEEHVLKSATLQKQVALLRTIPGVGLLVAVTLLAEVPLITSFGRARRVAAFVGLTPSLAQSGTSINRRGVITRQGPALLRKMLYMAAIQVVRKSNELNPVYEAMLARGKSKMCALIAIMHKIVRLAYGVLKHETAFAPNLAKL